MCEGAAGRRIVVFLRPYSEISAAPIRGRCRAWWQKKTGPPLHLGQQQGGAVHGAAGGGPM